MPDDRIAHVLDAIDGALADYGVSAGAMRWTPEPAEVAGPVLLIGGSPAALALRRQLDTPEARERFMAALADFGARVQRDMIEPMSRALAAAAESLSKFYAAAREAGMLPDAPPSDARSRALWLRQHRNTGPDRPTAQRAKRPRSV